MGQAAGEHGLWDIEDHAATAVAEFLAARHVGRRAEANDADCPRPGSPIIACKARSPDKHDGSGVQALRRKGPCREVGQVRILLAVWGVREEYFDADGVSAMPSRRKDPQEGSELFPRLQDVRHISSDLDRAMILNKS